MEIGIPNIENYVIINNVVSDIMTNIDKIPKAKANTILNDGLY